MEYSNTIWLRLIILICVFISACSSEEEIKQGKIITVNAEQHTNNLFYSGTIQPLKMVAITSPADGAIVEMPFQYGESVKSGQLLFLISSTKFLADYKAALMSYLKAKSEFNSNQTQLSEAEFLHKNELISEDEFKMRKDNFYSSQLSFLQAKDNLENLIHQLGVKDIDLYKLTIADVDKITKIMQLQMNNENYLRIVSPADGIVLAANKNDEENKRFSAGDNVKQSDVLAVIGNMHGFSVRIKVSELTVNMLKPGQKVKVTGIAFPEQLLEGRIERVDRQGETTSGGLPNFLVEIIVPKLTAQQQKLIHVGMSAKVEIDIQESPQIFIPINAISERNGVTHIKLYDDKRKQTKELAIKTGQTTMDQVTVLSGLKSGDRIIVPTQA